MRVCHAPDGNLGTEILDFDPTHLDAEGARALLDLVYRDKLVVLRGQRLAPAEYVAFAKKLGTPQVYFQAHYLHPEHPEIFVNANVPLDGKKVGVAGTGRYWHTDYQFFEEPLPLTMVYPQRIPNIHRHTMYVDMERALARLPAAITDKLVGRRAKQEAKFRYKVQAWDIDKSLAELLDEVEKMCPPVFHPAIITHPVTGARCLYVSEGFTTGVEGLSHEENRALLAELFPRIVEEAYAHEWREGDILLWDNRQLIHKASTVSSGEPNVSFRIGVYDGRPFYTEAR